MEEAITNSDAQASPPTQTPQHTVQDLQNIPTLRYKIHIFIHDLRHFDEKVDSRSGLDSTVDASHIGEPYFPHSEVEMIKSNAVINNSEQTLRDLIQETLDERLNRRMKKRVESEDYRVCAAHDPRPQPTKDFKPVGTSSP